MCIIFIYSNGNPLPGGYKLIVASNRDEFYARPALPAAAWVENPSVYGGEFIKVHKNISLFIVFVVMTVGPAIIKMNYYVLIEIFELVINSILCSRSRSRGGS